MSDYTGVNMYLQWIYSGGTVVLSADYRNFSKTPGIDLVDVSAGGDTDRTYLTALKDGTYQYSALHQAGGSVLETALTEGTMGTLVISPEGTASGKPKETVPAIAMGAQMNYVYNNATEVSCAFQKNGARTPGTW